MAESRAQARDAERVNDLKQIQVSLELYYNRNKQYPPSLNDISDYIEEIPHDPILARSGNPEDYQYETTGQQYGLAALSDDETIWCQLTSAGYSGTIQGVSPDLDCPFY